MIRFAADENFHNDVLRGLSRRVPDLDIVRIQDTEIYGADDPAVLEWVANEGRILLTHDVRTMPRFAYQRIDDGKHMPGIFVIHDDIPVGQVIEDLLAIVGASDAKEWNNRVLYFPI